MDGIGHLVDAIWINKEEREELSSIWIVSDWIQQLSRRIEPAILLQAGGDVCILNSYSVVEEMEIICLVPYIRRWRNCWGEYSLQWGRSGRIGFIQRIVGNRDICHWWRVGCRYIVPRTCRWIITPRGEVGFDHWYIQSKVSLELYRSFRYCWE